MSSFSPLSNMFPPRVETNHPYHDQNTLASSLSISPISSSMTTQAAASSCSRGRGRERDRDRDEAGGRRNTSPARRSRERGRERRSRSRDQDRDKDRENSRRRRRRQTSRSTSRRGRERRGGSSLSRSYRNSSPSLPPRYRRRNHNRHRYSPSPSPPSRSPLPPTRRNQQTRKTSRYSPSPSPSPSLPPLSSNSTRVKLPQYFPTAAPTTTSTTTVVTAAVESSSLPAPPLLSYPGDTSLFGFLPLEWWDRSEACREAKSRHVEIIDSLAESREDLVLQTTLWNQETVLEENMFPYETPPGVKHFTLWSRQDLTKLQIVSYVERWLRENHPQVKRWQYDDNLGERSIELFHVHVFIEMDPFSFTPREGMEYLPPHMLE